jgi:hypothetical protein
VNAQTKIKPPDGSAGIAIALERSFDLTDVMTENNISSIQRYPGGWFTVALMTGEFGRGKSVGEAYRNIGAA